MYSTCQKEHGEDAGVCIEWMCLSSPFCRLGWGGGSQGAVTTQREERREGGGESVSKTWAFHQSTATAEGGSSVAVTVQLKLIMDSD